PQPQDRARAAQGRRETRERHPSHSAQKQAPPAGRLAAPSQGGVERGGVSGSAVRLSVVPAKALQKQGPIATRPAFLLKVSTPIDQNREAVAYRLLLSQLRLYRLSRSLNRLCMRRVQRGHLF